MFIKENLNPKGRKTGDCSTRAIAKAAGIDYMEALDLQYQVHRTKGYAYGTTKNTYLVLQHLGFIPCVVRVPKGSTRPTVADIMKEHQGARLVMSVSGHLTCAVNNILYDLWDCSYKAVYKYWIRKN